MATTPIISKRSAVSAINGTCVPSRHQDFSSGRVQSMHKDQVNGSKKPLRALGAVTGVSGRTEYRNPIVCLVFTRVENIHIPATSACNACLISRAEAFFVRYDATATLVSRKKSS